MDLSDVELPDDAEVFMCGPLPFMQAIRHQLIARGVPADRIQYEVFQARPVGAEPRLTTSITAGGAGPRKTGTTG